MRHYGNCLLHSLLSVADPLERELADFFGQAKSSVATDEDIQRAGLQTFKASQIRTVGEGGKIASNCLDKVRA